MSDLPEAARCRTASTTSWDVLPFGLLMTSAPSSGAGLVVVAFSKSRLLTCGQTLATENTYAAGGLPFFISFNSRSCARRAPAKDPYEMQFRNAAELQALDQFAPDESGSMLQGLDRVVCSLFVPSR